MDFGKLDSDDLTSTSSINNFKTIKSHYADLGFEAEVDDYDDDEEPSYPCPYCSEDFIDPESVEDHIADDHPSKADFDSESCPICSARVGSEMIGHLFSKHTDTFDIEQLLRLKKADPYDNEFHYGSSRTSRGSYLDNASSNGAALDDLLSFICEVPQKEEVQDIKSSSSALLSSEDKLAVNEDAERVVVAAPISEERALEDKEARSRCDFVQRLTLSAFFDDDDDL